MIIDRQDLILPSLTLRAERSARYRARSVDGTRLRPARGSAVARWMTGLADVSDLFIYLDAFIHRKSLARGARWRQSRDARLRTGELSAQAIVRAGRG